MVLFGKHSRNDSTFGRKLAIENEHVGFRPLVPPSGDLQREEAGSINMAMCPRNQNIRCGCNDSQQVVIVSGRKCLWRALC